MARITLNIAVEIINNYCDKINANWRKYVLGKKFMTKICKDGYLKINGKIIELQYPSYMDISSFVSVVSFYPYKKLIFTN